MRVAGRSSGHSAGQYVIQQVTRSESDDVGAQQVFFQARELREPKREARVIAQSA